MQSILIFALLVGQPYSVWTVDSMTKVQVTDRPPAVPAVSIGIQLARCEVQSIQIAIRSDKRIPSVALQPAPLWNGALSLPPVTWKVVGVLQTTKYSSLPELLLPMSSFELPANTTIAMLVSVTAPCDARATSYQNALYVKTSSGSTAITMQADVSPFAISQASTQGALHLLASWTLSDFGTAAEYQAYGDLMLEHRMSPDNIWRNGTPNPDTLEHWYQLGMTGFNVYKADSAYTPSIDTFFAALAKQPHGAELRAVAYFFGYDEKPRGYLDCAAGFPPPCAHRSGVSYTNVVGAPDLNDARANAQMLHAHYPDVPIYSTAHVYTSPWADPIGDLVYYGFSTVLAEHSLFQHTDGDVVRSVLDTTLKPRRMHAYRSYLGYRADLPSPALNARAMFWAQFQQQVDGTSTNNTNRWSASPATISMSVQQPYTFASGNSADDLIFHGPAGPIAGMRMQAIRDGMQDYEYLWMLGQRISTETARELAEQVTINWVLPTTPATLLTTRAIIAGYLSQPTLSGHPVPEHRSTGVTSPFLTWQSDQLAAKYDVYLGDEPAAVRDAGWKSTEYKGRSTTPGLRIHLQPNHTYFWRVDALTAAGLVCKGYVWKFTTGSL